MPASDMPVITVQTMKGSHAGQGASRGLQAAAPPWPCGIKAEPSASEVLPATTRKTLSWQMAAQHPNAIQPGVLRRHSETWKQESRKGGALKVTRHEVWVGRCPATEVPPCIPKTWRIARSPGRTSDQDTEQGRRAGGQAEPLPHGRCAAGSAMAAIHCSPAPPSDTCPLSGLQDQTQPPRARVSGAAPVWPPPCACVAHVLNAAFILFK